MFKNEKFSIGEFITNYNYERIPTEGSVIFVGDYGFEILKATDINVEVVRVRKNLSMQTSIADIEEHTRAAKEVKYYKNEK